MSRFAIASVTILVLPALVGFACPRRPMARHVARAEVIFYGKALSSTKKRGADLKVAWFKVIKVYKGKLSSARLAVSDCIGPKCGPLYRHGRFYLLFARRLFGKLYGPGFCSPSYDLTACAGPACHERMAGRLQRLYRAFPPLAKSPPMIPGTTIPHTPAGHAILAVIEHYRSAMMLRDAAKLMTLAHPAYHETAGTVSTADDYGYRQLGKILQQRFASLSAVRLKLGYRSLRFAKNGDALLDVRYAGSFKLRRGGRTLHRYDLVRIHLRRHGGKWRITRGM